MKCIFAVILIVLQITAYSQRRRPGGGSSYYAVGAELNPFPFVTGGYSGSLWWGTGHIRLIGSGAYSTTPQFLVPSGFEQNKIRSYALHGEFFFDESFKNLWIRGGAEYWQGKVTNSEDGETGEYTNYIATLGAGFIIKVWNQFYINPGTAVHLVVAGERVVEVGNATYSVNSIIPNLTVKIGYHYPLARAKPSGRKKSSGQKRPHRKR